MISMGRLDPKVVRAIIRTRNIIGKNLMPENPEEKKVEVLDQEVEQFKEIGSVVRGMLEPFADSEIKKAEIETKAKLEMWKSDVKNRAIAITLIGLALILAIYTKQGQLIKDLVLVVVCLLLNPLKLFKKNE